MKTDRYLTSDGMRMDNFLCEHLTDWVMSVYRDGPERIEAYQRIYGWLLDAENDELQRALCAGWELADKLSKP